MEERLEDRMAVIAAHIAGEPLPCGGSFDQWLAHGDNRELYESVLQLQKGEVALLPDILIDVDGGWEAVSQRIEQNRQRRIKKIRLAIVALATSVAILLGVALLMPSSVTQSDAVMLTEERGGGEPVTVTLDDGSIVAVNRNSGLFYPEKFAGSTRSVKLSGEGFFDVAKDSLRPFVIDFDRFRVVVKGTSFNILQKDGRVELSVLSGSVELADTKGVIPKVVVNAGQSSVFDEATRSFVLRNFINPNALAWKTRRIVFNNTPFSDVCATLESVYGFDIEIDTTAGADDLTLTASFSHDDFEYVTKVISLTLDISFNRSDEGKYFVTLLK